MYNCGQIIDLHELAKGEGRRMFRRRKLLETLLEDRGKHFVGIVGPRGAGKTILLRQMAASDPDAVYLSADTLDEGTDLFEVARTLTERYQYKTLLLDEIHFLDHWQAGLKQIYDFLQIRVVFTSSLALALHRASYDLARRVKLHSLDYFSFAEFLEFRYEKIIEPLGLDDLLAGNWKPVHLRAERFFAEYIEGGLLPFALEEPDPLPLLGNTIETIILKDIPSLLSLKLEEISKLRKLISFVGRSQVDGINYSSLSANLGITKYKAEQYAAAFESAFVLQRVMPAGTNVLREPKILLVPPVRLLHQLANEAKGALREDFFALAMRQAGIDFQYLKGRRGEKTPDFLVKHASMNLALEVGGKGKGRSQFKGVKADRKIILATDVTATQDRWPLHLLGFLVSG
ncbi:MAG: ATP-binding protein [Verrucomicrobiales bacterium]|nr:ATP-binding protein [Verrucomicrobiales bacterium]